MKNLRKLVLGGGAVALLALLGFASVTRAQCPTATSVPPFSDTDSFMGPFSAEEYVGFSGCRVEVSYCWRFLADGTRQIVIEAVWYPPGDTACDTIPHDVLIREAVYKLLHDANIGAIQYPPCVPPYLTITHVIFATCWALHHTPNPYVFGTQGTWFGPCWDGTSYCLQHWKLCYDGVGQVEDHGVTYEIIGTGDCANGTVPIENPWVPENCYNLDPCGGQ